MKLDSFCAVHIFGLIRHSVQVSYPADPDRNAHKDAPMIKNFNLEDMQKLSQTNMDTAKKAFGEWNKGWQAIAAEITDYTKKSFEEGTATFEKLASAKSVEQAIEIQTGFAKRAYDGYMHQMSKIGGMYADLAKEAYKPVEKALQNGR